MRSGLTAMSEDLLRLCDQEGWSPTIVVGHSAGAALALRMAQLAPTLVSRVVGINAALGNFKGLAGVVFPIMAKILALTPLVPDFFSGAAAQSGRIEALLDSTGSQIDPDGVALYRKLVGDRDHVDGVLMMMAQWSLNGLLDRLDIIEAKVLLITGENDKTVPPDTSAKAAARLRNATWENWPKLGHLMHEEKPEPMARAIKGWADA